MIEEIRTCAWCGETFVTTTKTKYYCSKSCLNKGLKHGIHARDGETRARLNPNRKNMETLGQIAKEAREHNLSYGQYVARYLK